ncbi:AAA family ATPase [Photobacterium swingsii]|uniref:AAA family ATPase n=1 Tax=Photobacterium swingsii TaxID=680026 RepID=UPI004068BEFA
MKLIYIHVDNYKVLTDREISLSSQHHVRKENNSYIINDTQIGNDFYDIDLDIVAFFGKNGSGKSTTIELITLILSNNIPNESQVVCIYEYQSNFYYFTNREKQISVLYKNKPCIEIYNDDIEMEKINVIYFSHQVEPLAKKITIRNKKNFKYTDCSNQAHLSKLGRKDFTNKQVKLCFDLLESYDMTRFGISDVPMIGASYPIQEILKSIRYINKKLASIAGIQEANEYHLDTYNICKPLCESIEYFENKYLDTVRTNHIDKVDFNEPYLFQNSLNSFILLFSTKLQKNIAEALLFGSKRYVDILLELDIIKACISNVEKNYINNSDYNGLNIFSIYIDYLTSKLEIYSISQFIDVLHQNKLPFDSESKEYLRKDNLYDLYQVSNFIESTIKKGEQGIFNISSYEEFTGLNETFANYSNLFSNFEIKWNGISSGQYSLLTLFSRIYNQCSHSNALVIFLDEGEINLHPEWQRTYISDLLNFFSWVKDDGQYIKLVLTSHSPFVLSDLPRESINIMGDDLDEDVTFFGSNIYDIYNKGFMLERTVGQFSYGKISDAIKKIKKSGYDESVEAIVSLIGDDFVRKIAKEFGGKND